MKYLTRIHSFEGDDYQAHQTLKGIFDQDRILFQRGQFETVVLSGKAPSSTHSLSSTKDVSTFLESISYHDEFLFTVRLNAIVTRRIDGKGKRYPVETTDLKDWIRRKLEQGGMDAEFIYDTEGPRISRKREHRITLSSVFVTGVCEVKDANLFRSTIAGGIGHSKGLGFGMFNIFANL